MGFDGTRNTGPRDGDGLHHPDRGGHRQVRRPPRTASSSRVSSNAVRRSVQVGALPAKQPKPLPAPNSDFYEVCETLNAEERPDLGGGLAGRFAASGSGMACFWQGHQPVAPVHDRRHDGAAFRGEGPDGLHSPRQEFRGRMGLPDWDKVLAMLGHEFIPSLEDELQEEKERVTKSFNWMLERLEEAGPKGSKAAAIRGYARDNLQCDFSIKAVGMTLNRLSKEGRARRAGQVWFPVQQRLQTEDDGAITF